MENHQKENKRNREKAPCNKDDSRIESIQYLNISMYDECVLVCAPGQSCHCFVSAAAVSVHA